MTTSNNPSLPTPPEKSSWTGSHWDEMIATLAVQEKQCADKESLASWIGNDLSDLEIRLSKYGSPRSRAVSASGRR